MPILRIYSSMYFPQTEYAYMVNIQMQKKHCQLPKSSLAPFQSFVAPQLRIAISTFYFYNFFYFF